jgi:hypothetical protein
MLFEPRASGEAAATRRTPPEPMSVSLGPPPVVAICGEVDIQSAAELREELPNVPCVTPPLAWASAFRR